MFTVKPLPEFSAWLDGLTDVTVRNIVVARIRRLGLGLMGDVKPVGEGVSELRIHYGAGWRVYFMQRGKTVIVLLAGRLEEYSKDRYQAGQSSRGGPGGEPMKKRIKVADLPEFDAAKYLDSEEAIAVYLTDILEANHPGLLAAALGDIARARGMTEIAKAAGITREALYKALRPDSEPRLDTINRVCAALGVRLVAQPIHSSEHGADQKAKKKRKKTAPLKKAA